MGDAAAFAAEQPVVGGAEDSEAPLGDACLCRTVTGCAELRATDARELV
ncbi:hypothetical protein ACWC0A_23105 [Streptomyces scopuliridis]